MEINKFKTIMDMIETELKDANNKFPLFQSRHEGFGVMLEELSEAKKDIKEIKEGLIYDYWKMCKNSKNVPYNSAEINTLLNSLESNVVNAISELIQVGAMVKKARMLEKKGGSI